MANMSLVKNPMPQQDPNVRNKNFQEVALGYTKEQAIDEAQRCLNCKKKPCVTGCPVQIDIPAFIEKLAKAQCSMLILPAEHFIGAPLAYIINYCREFGMKIGLTLGCYTPLCFVDESINDIDRLHIVTHGVDETDGQDNWGWRRSVPDLVARARDLIDKKNPRCELAIDGGLRHDNMDLLIKHNPDVVILSSAIFRDPDGITAGVQKCRKALDDLSIKYNL